MVDRVTVSLNFRVAPEVRDRVEALAERYDTSMTSVAKVALILGVEALEGLKAAAPEEKGVPGAE